MLSRRIGKASWRLWNKWRRWSTWKGAFMGQVHKSVLDGLCKYQYQDIRSPGERPKRYDHVTAAGRRRRKWTMLVVVIAAQRFERPPRLVPSLSSQSQLTCTSFAHPLRRVRSFRCSALQIFAFIKLANHFLSSFRTHFLHRYSEFVSSSDRLNDDWH